MGTSAGYQMPTGGDWTPLKTDANRFVREGPESAVTPQQLMSEYVRALGGASGITGSGPTGGSGGSGAGGRSGTGSARAAAASGLRVGMGVGGFLSRVAQDGLDAALREYGLEHLVGKSATELSSGLLDALAGPASTIDDSAARAALAELNKELLKDAETADDVERLLTATLDSAGLEATLMRFFGIYIYERFCRDFYERWVKAAGSSATDGGLQRVRRYIQGRLRAETSSREVRKVDWRGADGARVVSEILSATCSVFGVPS